MSSMADTFGREESFPEPMKHGLERLYNSDGDGATDGVELIDRTCGDDTARDATGVHGRVLNSYSARQVEEVAKRGHWSFSRSRP